MKVLILAYSNFKTDPRVRRQIAALKGHEIITCGWYDEADFHIYTEPPPSFKRKITRLFWLLTGQFEKFFWDDNKKKLAEKLRKLNPDRIIANNIKT
jgi:hypothetical protein